MFTGLVETIGTVSTLSPLDNSVTGGGGTSLLITSAGSILNDAHLGDSICVNGTCLTVTEVPSPDAFKVGVAPETLRRTNLGSLKEGMRVNLERAVLPDTRMGGHFLQGHVDTVAIIANKTPDGNAVTFRFAPRDSGVLRYIVEKGFVAVDGTSLTVTAVNDTESWFEIMLIAYSQSKVVLTEKSLGDEVNIEVDMVGKYVEKSVLGYFQGEGSSAKGTELLEKMVNKIVEAKLKYG